MKKIILSIVAVLAVLWVALFVSEQQVLVWETGGYNYDGCIKGHFPSKNRSGWGCTVDALENPWVCTYFNGRRLFRTTLGSKVYGSCPNFRRNQ